MCHVMHNEKEKDKKVHEVRRSNGSGLQVQVGELFETRR